jgi:hypothetical protein
MVQEAIGKVQNGTLVLDEPVTLPDGTEVRIRIEPVGQLPTSSVLSPEELTRLPFFGMWADREEMADSVAWVRRMRDQWQQRAARQD